MCGLVIRKKKIGNVIKEIFCSCKFFHLNFVKWNVKKQTAMFSVEPAKNYWEKKREKRVFKVSLCTLNLVSSHTATTKTKETLKNFWPQQTKLHYCLATQTHENHCVCNINDRVWYGCCVTNKQMRYFVKKIDSILGTILYMKCSTESSTNHQLMTLKYARHFSFKNPQHKNYNKESLNLPPKK